MIRIKNKFKELKQNKQKAFGVFLTAGYPSPKYSKDIFKKIIDAKIDFIEIGLPFSDPMADGPLIQHSSQIAIQRIRIPNTRKFTMLGRLWLFNQLGAV